MKAVVWSKPACAFCEKAKSLLKMKGIEYEEKNIAEGVDDKRCEVSYAAFYNRLNKGIDPEAAMQKNGSKRQLEGH